MKCKCVFTFIDDANVNNDGKRNVYSEASIREAAIIPMSTIFPWATDASRFAEATAGAAERGSIFYQNVKAIHAILKV